MVASMPRRGEAVMVIVTSRGTLARTRSSMPSVGRTSYLGAPRKAIRAFLPASSIRPSLREAASAMVTTPASPPTPHETCRRRTIWYCRAPRNGRPVSGMQAGGGKRRSQGKDHVPVERCAGPRGGEPDEGCVPGQLAVQTREIECFPIARLNRPVMVHHRAPDRQHAVAGVDYLDHASLAGPVHQRRGGDLPEATPAPAGVMAGANAVGVAVPVQPEDDIAEPQHQSEEI